MGFDVLLVEVDGVLRGEKRGVDGKGIGVSGGSRE